MIDDGTFDEIWYKHNKRFIEMANLKNRKIFVIENEFVPSVVPLDEAKYWYFPEGVELKE